MLCMLKQNVRKLAAQVMQHPYTPLPRSHPACSQIDTGATALLACLLILTTASQTQPSSMLDLDSVC